MLAGGAVGENEQASSDMKTDHETSPEVPSPRNVVVAGRTGEDQAWEPPPDIASTTSLSSQIQQQNQQLVFGKLLHDLRNPIHSLSITMELFDRLARRDGDLQALVDRAALYVGPAQSALDNLQLTCERIGRWLSEPAAPNMTAFPVQAWLEEMALLLRASPRPVRAHLSVATAAQMRLVADRVRLSHALFHYCANQPRLGSSRESGSGSDDGQPQVWLRARVETDGLIRIEVEVMPPVASEGHQSDALTPAGAGWPLRDLIQTAGGRCGPERPDGLTMHFRGSAG